MPVSNEHVGLIEQLRAEAADVKSCFRQYAFQSLALGALVTGGVFASFDKFPMVPFVAVPLVLLLAAVERIGIHKFSTANRLHGFQLHLERCGTAVNANADIGWEEACRAWRIVQATIFAELYETPNPPEAIRPINAIERFFHALRRAWPWLDLDPRFYRRKDVAPSKDDAAHEYSWFMPKMLAAQERAAYHAGSYLDRVFHVLSLMQFFATIPLLLLLFLPDPSQSESSRNLAASSFGLVSVKVVGCVAFVLVNAFIWLNYKSLCRRRELLEDGLLSIHSCAIVWKAVVMAHSLAWDAAHPTGYTQRLARIARRLVDHPYQIQWRTTHTTLPEEWTEPDPAQTGGQ